nr:RnfH family protein [methane-oxidizing endosymbiont of Gigantopelta aegis]
MAPVLEVEVAYAKPQTQALIAVTLTAEATVEQAIIASGILERFPEIDLNTTKVGVFGKICRLSDSVKTGDRIEIYRPLSQNPMEARRQRAMTDKVRSGRA